MTSVLISFLSTLRGVARSRAALHLEILALRHQLQVLQTVASAPAVLSNDRPVALGVSGTFMERLADSPGDREAGDRHRLGSQGLSPILDVEESAARRATAVPPDVRMLIRTMSRDNPLWGAPRIHGELLKLGVDVSQATVATYMARPNTRSPGARSWRTISNK